MKWTITFLHNDAGYEDVTVNEAGLAKAFAKAMKREFPCHVIAVEEVPDKARREAPNVEYCWTDDGEPELCGIAAAEYHGEECYHCTQPIEGAGTALTAPDGDVYAMHTDCAYKGCAGRDFEVIAATCDLPSWKRGGEGA